MSNTKTNRVELAKTKTNRVRFSIEGRRRTKLEVERRRRIELGLGKTEANKVCANAFMQLRKAQTKGVRVSKDEDEGS